MLIVLHFELHYLSIDSKIVMFSSKQTKNLGLLFNIELMDEQSNMAAGGGAALRLQAGVGRTSCYNTKDSVNIMRFFER